MNPKVSIVVPCFNKAQFLKETLESIKHQQFTNWECIIVDDGSTDNSSKIIKEFCTEDSRFKMIGQNNQGVSSARNRGFSEAIGEYFLPFDADDLMDTNYIFKAVQILDFNPNLDIVYCDSAYIGNKTGFRKVPDFDIITMLHRNLVFVCAVFRRKVFDKIGGYCPDLIHGAEDWDFWLSAIELGFRFYKIDEVLFFYRKIVNSRDAVFKSDYEINMSTEILIFKRHIDLYLKHWGGMIDLYRKYYSIKNSLNKISGNFWFSWQIKLGRFIRSLYKPKL